MKNTEHDFSEYSAQLESLKQGLANGDLLAYQKLIAFDNAITGLESTRFPGNTALLEFKKQAREILADADVVI